MATVKSDLDTIQARLHDNGVLWPRTELLRWWNDGYRQLLAESQAVRRFVVLDVPGRFTYSFAHEWEDRHITGTSFMPVIPALDATYRCTAAWEVEQAENIAPSAAYAGLTQLWERTMIADSDRHFRFALPKQHERLVRVAWDHRTLHPISVRELDSDTRWWQRGGEPLWWTPGVGRLKSIEMYEIKTDYQQSYEHQLFEAGIPRAFTPGGSRTYGVDPNSLTAAQSFGYTSSGDVQALTAMAVTFAPQSGISQEFERSFAPSPGYRFTLLTDASLATLGGTQIWEVGNPAAVGTTRGMWPWEHGGDDQSIVPGIGYSCSADADYDGARFIGDASQFTTLAANGTDFITVSWEDGLGSGDGTARGTYHWEYLFFHLSVTADVIVARFGRTNNYTGDVPLPDERISISGLGWRFTQPARTTAQQVVGELGFCTQAWEVQQLEGTTIGAGANLGSAAWEHEDLSLSVPLFGTGTIRAITSNDRQYLAQGSGASSQVYGGVRQWASTDLALWITHVIIPDADVAEADEPDMIPAPLQKYLRAYVWSRAFGRPGEGTRPLEGEHYLQRFQRGVRLLRRFADMAQRDRVAVREGVGAPDRARPPRVRFPSEFEKVW